MRLHTGLSLFYIYFVLQSSVCEFPTKIYLHPQSSFGSHCMSYLIRVLNKDVVATSHGKSATSSTAEISKTTTIMSNNLSDAVGSASSNPLHDARTVTSTAAAAAAAAATSKTSTTMSDSATNPVHNAKSNKTTTLKAAATTSTTITTSDNLSSKTSVSCNQPVTELELATSKSGSSKSASAGPTLPNAETTRAADPTAKTTTPARFHKPTLTIPLQPPLHPPKPTLGRCRVCHKPVTDVEFSNAQRKRLKKGKPAACKACMSADIGSSNAQRKRSEKGQPATSKTSSSQPPKPRRPTLDRNFSRSDQCSVCHKPATDTEFSNAQRKRLKKGKPATCKICSLKAANSKTKIKKKGSKTADTSTATAPQKKIIQRIQSTDRTPSFDTGVTNELFQHYLTLDCKSLEYYETFTKLLSQHMFVKTRKTTIELANYTINIQGFQASSYTFSKWISKTPEGQTFKDMAGGTSDDALYRISAVLRTCLPRGCHSISIASKKTGNTVLRCIFRGMPKFTGLSASDDGDDAASNHNEDFFYHKGKIADVRTFFATTKSNGENAKLSVLVIEGKRYLMSGSKMTCDIWPANEPYTKHQEEPLIDDDKGKYPGAGYTIGCVYSNWFRTQTKQVQDLYFKNMWSVDGHHKTIMGEVNRPWEEHILPIATHHAFIEIFSIIDESGLPLSPIKVFEFFDRLDIKPRDVGKDTHFLKTQIPRQDDWWDHIWPSLKDCSIQEPLTQSRNMYSIAQSRHQIEELDAQIDLIRASTTLEGSVLYLCDKDDIVLNIVKVCMSVEEGVTMGCTI